MKSLPLTIEGTTYIIPFSKHFFYDGTLKSCPEWFLDILEEYENKRLPTGAVHFFNLPNGCPSVYPNSIVLCRENNSIHSIEGSPNAEAS